MASYFEQVLRIRLEECIQRNASIEEMEILIARLLDQYMIDNEYSEKAIQKVSNIFLRVHEWILKKYGHHYISNYLLNESIFISS
jgi:hypothetical protein